MAEAINVQLLRDIAAEFELDKDGNKYDWFNVTPEELERFKTRTFPRRYHQDHAFFRTLSEEEKERRNDIFKEFYNIVDHIKDMYAPGYQFRQQWSDFYMQRPASAPVVDEPDDVESDTETKTETKTDGKKKAAGPVEKKKKTGPYKYVYSYGKDNKGKPALIRKKVYLEDEKKKKKIGNKSSSSKK